MSELLIPMIRPHPEARGSVAAQCLHTIEQVHHRGHQERAETQAKESAENTLERVSDRKSLTPQCPVRGEQFLRCHLGGAELDIVPVVELPPTTRQHPSL